MANNKNKKKKPAVSAPVRRTTEEKLRGIVNLKVARVSRYTQTELAEQLGISVRTLRRIKNVQGYRPLDSTLQRIKGDVSRIDRSVRKLHERGEAFLSKTVTTRGRRRREIQRVEGSEYKLPPMPIMQSPLIFESKSGASRTFMLNVANWTTAEKIAYMKAMHESGRFSSWHARVDLRVYIVKKLTMEYGDLSDVPPEVLADATANHFVMIGPYEFGRTLSNLRSAIEIVKRYDDAGRKIVEVYFVENIKKGKKK